MGEITLYHAKVALLRTAPRVGLPPVRNVPDIGCHPEREREGF